MWVLRSRSQNVHCALMMCTPPGLDSPQIQAANPISRSLFNTAYRYKQASGLPGLALSWTMEQLPAQCNA